MMASCGASAGMSVAPEARAVGTARREMNSEGAKARRLRAEISCLNMRGDYQVRGRMATDSGHVPIKPRGNAGPEGESLQPRRAAARGRAQHAGQVIIPVLKATQCHGPFPGASAAIRG